MFVSRDPHHRADNVGGNWYESRQPVGRRTVSEHRWRRTIGRRSDIRIHKYIFTTWEDTVLSSHAASLGPLKGSTMHLLFNSIRIMVFNLCTFQQPMIQTVYSEPVHPQIHFYYMGATSRTALTQGNAIMSLFSTG